MESLLLVVAELLTVPLLVAAALGVEMLGLAVLGVGQALVRPKSAARPRLIRWWRRIVWTATGVFGLLLAGLVFVDLVFFEPSLRLALDQIELRSGVDLGFREGRGSLFTGRLELHDVTARRAGGEGAEFTLTVRELVIDVDMWGVLRTATPLQLVRVAGVRGQIVRREAGGAPRPLHAFAVERLELEDVQVDFEDAIGAPFQTLPVGFERFSVAPLRSEYAMLDVLCHSEGRGQARGYGFGAGAGAWTARGIPLGPAAHKLGPAGRWIRGGDLDVTLTCLGGPDPEAVPLAVELRLHDFQISPPGDSGRHLPASRIAEAIAKLGPELQVRSAVTLPRERFRGATNVGQLGLWEGAIQAWNLDLGTRLGLTREELLLLGIGSRVLEKLRPATPRN